MLGPRGGLRERAGHGAEAGDGGGAVEDERGRVEVGVDDWLGHEAEEVDGEQHDTGRDPEAQAWRGGCV